MGNRAGQRRHRLATTGVGGERQVPPALDLGPSACAALIQEPDDQERLDGQQGHCTDDVTTVAIPDAWLAKHDDTGDRQQRRIDAPPLHLPPVEDRRHARGFDGNVFRLRPFEDPKCHLANARGDTDFAAHHAADHALADVRVEGAVNRHRRGLGDLGKQLVGKDHATAGRGRVARVEDQAVGGQCLERREHLRQRRFIAVGQGHPASRRRPAPTSRPPGNSRSWARTPPPGFAWLLDGASTPGPTFRRERVPAGRR